MERAGDTAMMPPTPLEALAINWPMLVIMGILVGAGAGAAWWLSRQLSKISTDASDAGTARDDAIVKQVTALADQVRVEVAGIKTDLDRFRETVQGNLGTFREAVHAEHSMIRERLATVETIVARQRTNGRDKHPGG